MILGVGTDLVHLPTFRDQLEEPGSSFVAGTFTPSELETANARPSGDPVPHLAARFAAKEAFIKAWSASRPGGGEETILAPEAVNFREIEVLSDAAGRPTLALTGAIAAAVGRRRCRAHVSLSHDGPFATATVILEGENR